MIAPLDLQRTATAEADHRDLDDRLLLIALQVGEQDAYERLIARFQTPVYNLAYRLLNDPSDAADVLQEVFIKIFRNVSTFRGDSSLRTWVYRIAVNESYNHRRWMFRHRHRETGLEESFEGSEVREKPIRDSGETPYEFTMNREAQALLEDALAAITPAYRSVLVLREIEELGYEEIASILGISLGTVKSRMVRGREALRQELSRRLEHQHGVRSVLARALTR